MMAQRLMLPAGFGGGEIPNRSLEFTATSNQSLELSNTNWGSYDRSKWAFSCWARRKSSLSTDTIISRGRIDGATMEFNIKFDFWRQIRVETFNTTTNGVLVTPVESSAGHGYEAGSFYHILVAFDASLTAADRLQLYVNGVRVTSFATSTDPVGDVNTTMGITRIGRQTENSYAANAYIYQPAFFSGTIPALSNLTSGGRPKDLRGKFGLWSLLHTTDTSTLEDDEIISANWTNNNTVVKSTVVV